MSSLDINMNDGNATLDNGEYTCQITVTVNGRDNFTETSDTMDVVLLGNILPCVYVCACMYDVYVRTYVRTYICNSIMYTSTHIARPNKYLNCADYLNLEWTFYNNSQLLHSVIKCQYN